MRDAIAIKVLCPGIGEGPVLDLGEPLSFWGGLDPLTGNIIDRWHIRHGQNVSGKVLAMPSGRGSSSGSSVLAEAIRLGTGPCAILLAAPDPIAVTGAMVAATLYGKQCPVALVPGESFGVVAASQWLKIECGEQGGTAFSTP